MTLTVCVPVWNGEAFVAETLEGLRVQSLRDIQVLISIEKGDDGSLDICRAFAGADPRFEVFAQSTRFGWIGNANWLLRRVTTEFASVMPHDDVIPPNYLERLTDTLSKRPKAVLAHGDMRTFGRERVSYAGAVLTGDRFDRTLTHLCEFTNAAAWHGVFRAKMFEKVLLEEVNGPAADQVWQLHAAIQGDFAHDPGAVYRMRLHPLSVVAQARTVTGIPTDSHWVDHCVSCHQVATATGQWTSAQKQAITAACLMRASEAPTESMASLVLTAADFAERLSGQVAPGSGSMVRAKLPEKVLRHLQDRFSSVVANHGRRRWFSS